MCLSYIIYYPAIDYGSCMDMRNISKPILDYLRQNNHSVNMASCSFMKEYAEATANPATSDNIMYQKGMVTGIPVDELDEIERARVNFT